MKFGVITFPGSNCDQDMIYVLETIMGQEVEKLWHKDHDLKGCEFIVLPGGFSYGDYLRSGAIAQFSPIMKEVIEFAKNGGYVFGVCNGFQILCEAGLLPGTLQHNNNRQFICKNVYLKTESSNSLITRSITEGSVLKIPIAHGEGNYFDKPEAIQKLEDNDQVLFRYSTQDGEVNDAANPNGAVNNIAGICNEQRNVFGMMPHPERASDADLGNEDGRAIFESILSEVIA
ncbi:phosphoribosylformylglycinamidine synthase subunit PurQ [Salibacteraceae bacterium]|nr:phosphoribosylformylglycinamidine synthase subunit PurQ [Salibacteraceae bacterium]MDB4104890.1 phosphoribosylformylglycinamidine synthase subunit PurQ [Salibacteraceae bacterium]MDC1220105.1 phosphoribosylformylglycinamidine synthase subunit PurQ [bacterium]MDC1304843.1 phosphoribosylformylglycinamidine synthase subunit PurQ [Salibacteraceae bacterium]